MFTFDRILGFESVEESDAKAEDQVQDRPSSSFQTPISRRAARETALRAAYVIEMRGCSVREALDDPLVCEGNPVTEFTERLVGLMDENRDHLDDIIRAKIERWEFHRVAMIDRLILRLATSELVYIPDVPPKVTINEGIEIAKKYSTENSGRFINGVLDSIYGERGRGEKVPMADGRFRIQA